MPETRIWHGAHVMPGNQIGANCVLSQNVFVARNVTLGDRVKVQNNVSVYEGVVLEDDVFCEALHGLCQCSKSPGTCGAENRV